MGLENKTIMQFFRAMGAPQEIVIEVARISCVICKGSEEGMTSKQIFEGRNESYTATIGRDALQLMIDGKYLEYHMGLYKLTSGGRSTFSN